MKNQRFAAVSIMGFAVLNATLVIAVERAPFNPEFQEYQKQLQQRKFDQHAAAEHSLGYRPPPFMAPGVSSSLPASSREPKALPASYDLRDYSKVSHVRDQGDYGNCWCFATYGSMESCLLTGETWDFSENNMANTHGFDSAYGDGGNHYMALAYLARWNGPVLESDDPYSNGPASPGGLTVRKHIQSAQFIPDRTSFADNAAIKQAIMTYGGIYSAFYWNSAYSNSVHHTYYYNGSSSPNHAITLIGWDDAFDRAKFRTVPAGNGAFLVKNSWGALWGDGGYFWISYFDTNIGHYNCLFVNAEPTNNYASVFEHDTLGYCTSFGYKGTTTAWGANVFSSSSAIIEAVAFYAPAAGASYEISIYTDIAAGSPTGGTLSAIKTGTFSHGGYYTVALDEAVNCSGEFSIILKLTTPGYNWPIACEYPYDGYSSAATAAAGESYFSSDGITWEEAYYDGTYFNCCIKAFGQGGESPAPTPPTPSVTCEPVLADYDGDLKSDLGLLQSDGTWSLLCWTIGYGTFSSVFPNTRYTVQPGDFDGDRWADPAVYHASSGYWYFMASSRGYDWYYIRLPWLSGYLPACGDYDGDYRADPIAYDSSTGNWKILSSRYEWDGHYYEVNGWGGPGFLPLCADFDGDNYGDLMAYETASGFWHILASRDNAHIQQWFGLSGFTPVSGDFDGDRKADLGVYNKSTGLWAILLSTSGWNEFWHGVWDGSAP